MNKILESYVRSLVHQYLQEQAIPAPAAPPNSLGDLQTPLVKGFETGNLSQDADKILQAYKEKLMKRGVNVSAVKQAGIGTMGVAYDMGDKILKVTKDVQEAKASSIVAGKNIPNIIQVYDIWKFPDVSWYGLILEKLTPLTPEESNLLTRSVLDTGFTLLLHQHNNDWNAAMKALAQRSMKSYVSKAFQANPDARPENGGQGMSDPRIKNYVAAETTKLIQSFDRLTKEYKMRQLFTSLASLGIQYYDFHGGNYGRRADGTLVLFDLGRSISKGTAPAELTEKFQLLEQRYGKGLKINVL